MNDIDERMVIAAFWRRFRESRPRLVAEGDPDGLASMLATLQRIDPRLGFRVGKHRSPFDVVLSAEGHPELLPVIQRVADGAPKKPGCGVVCELDADLALGRRNPSRFPGNRTGDALFQLVTAGDDLSAAHDIAFKVLFRSKKNRDGFLRQLAARGLAGEALARASRAATTPWEIVVQRRMLATHAGISAFETTLAGLFEPFAGEHHGWVARPAASAG